MAPITATKAESKQPIQPWDEHDLTGWQTYFTNANVNPTGIWSAYDGVLALNGGPVGYLRTEKSYTDYHLHIEWRWPQSAGNSGLFLHLVGDDSICLPALNARTRRVRRVN